MPVFSALGAECTVLDYSIKQLENEKLVSEREGYNLAILPVSEKVLWENPVQPISQKEISMEIRFLLDLFYHLSTPKPPLLRSSSRCSATDRSSAASSCLLFRIFCTDWFQSAVAFSSRVSGMRSASSTPPFSRSI